MSFAKAWAAIEEEGIVANTWGINDAFCGSDGEVVVGADDEIIDSVLGIETV